MCEKSHWRPSDAPFTMMAVATATAGEKDGLGSPAGAASEIGLLKSELKAWEKDFASLHGRKPTPADVEADESVRCRYSAYAKLKSRSKTPMGSECRPTPCNLSCPSDEMFNFFVQWEYLARTLTLRSTVDSQSSAEGPIEPRWSRCQSALHVVDGKRLNTAVESQSCATLPVNDFTAELNI